MKNSAEHFIIQKAEKGDKKRIHNAVDMRTVSGHCNECKHGMQLLP
ncbi:hypothetical protein SOVF_116190 [Spinacia oleracea]|nr:hypothetical protein SOVF_116190 [Spinacia oleracea]